MKIYFFGERFHIRGTIPVGVFSNSVVRKGIAASIVKSEGEEAEFTVEQMDRILKALAECSKQYKGLEILEVNSGNHRVVVEL